MCTHVRVFWCSQALHKSIAEDSCSERFAVYVQMMCIGGKLEETAGNLFIKRIRLARQQDNAKPQMQKRFAGNLSTAKRTFEARRRTCTVHQKSLICESKRSRLSMYLNSSSNSVSWIFPRICVRTCVGILRDSVTTDSADSPSQ